MKSIYPKAPENLSVDFAKPGKEFKKGVIRVIAALIFFIAVYLVMLTAAVILAICFGLAGWYIVMAKIHFTTLLIACGLAVTGLMILYFLIKFLFEKEKSLKEGLVEIREHEHPELFAFIRKVSEEVGTDFPKHIYLTPEVNAFVFYDSNILSLFFPVKKNLAIGLGLVNMLNLSEFKAVLAHEFGHFSQKSTRAGSYVYQANRIIYNMLYDNRGYASVLQDIANLHYIIALFVKLTINIVEGMQWVQQQAYKVVNIQYGFLSRQMEFHADAIAAAVAGSNNLSHALQLIDIGDTVYNVTLRQYNEWVGEGIIANNFYKDLQVAAKHFAISNRIPYQNSLPVLKGADHYFINFKKVNIDNQWASHPTNEQREEALNMLNTIGEEISTTAWILFDNREALQKAFTLQLYKHVKWEKTKTTAGEELFEEAFKEMHQKFNFPEFYEGYYDNRLITSFGTEHVNTLKNTITDIKAFFKDNAHLGRQQQHINEDIDLLRQIEAHKDIKKFNFDGTIYSSKWVETIAMKLEADVKKLDEEIADKDKLVYTYFYVLSTANGGGTKLQQQYDLYFELQHYVKESHPKFIQLLNDIRPLYSDDNLTDIYKNAPQDLSESITRLKTLYREVQALFSKINVAYNYAIINKVSNFMEKELPVIKTDECTSPHINGTYNCTYDLFIWLGESLSVIKKQLLEKQLAYL